MSMNLYNIVYQLLRDNDCVVIPEFGGFVANYFEAIIDFPTQEFCPPRKKIAFNQNLKNNDGLLISYVSNANNRDWTSAENTVMQFVADLESKLKEDSFLEFGNLGSFSLKNNILVFTPNKNLNLLEDSYGLKTFSYPMIGNARKTIEIQRPLELSKTKSAKLNKKKRRLSPVVFYTTSAAVIAGLLFVAVQFDFIRLEKNPNQQVANIVPIELAESTTEDNNCVEVIDNAASVENVIEAETENNPELLEETAIDEALNTDVNPNEVETIVSNNLQIHVIGGSFSDSINAENYQSELISMGYDSHVLPTNNGMFRVTVKSFNENSNAVSELNSLRNSTGNQSLWILNW